MINYIVIGFTVIICIAGIAIIGWSVSITRKDKDGLTK